MDWPDGLKAGPIDHWPGALTPASQRKASAFKQPGYWEGPSGNRHWVPQKPMPLSNTLTILNREVRELGAEELTLLIALPPGRFRLDGRPYADAKPEHPGVIVGFQSKHGHLSYPCDTFTTWQDNLRAIALALEALRKVDRYGVTSHGEQYRGFLAIEATAAPAGFTTVEEARSFLWRLADLPAGENPTTSYLLRRAQRITHPDHGGDPATFQRVSLAEAKLRQEGLL
jgi:hypothetical protein